MFIIITISSGNVSGCFHKDNNNLLATTIIMAIITTVVVSLASRKMVVFFLRTIRNTSMMEKQCSEKLRNNSVFLFCPKHQKTKPTEKYKEIAVPSIKSNASFVNCTSANCVLDYKSPVFKRFQLISIQLCVQYFLSNISRKLMPSD